MNSEFFKVFGAYDLSCAKKDCLYHCFSVLDFVSMSILFFNLKLKREKEKALFILPFIHLIIALFFKQNIKSLAFNFFSGFNLVLMNISSYNLKKKEHLSLFTKSQ